MASKEPSKELREFYNIRLAALQVTLNTPELLTERIMQGKTIAQLRVENIYRILKEIDSKKRVISPNELKVLEKSFNSFFTHPNLEKVTKANYVNREFVNTVWKYWQAYGAEQKKAHAVHANRMRMAKAKRRPSNPAASTNLVTKNPIVQAVIQKDTILAKGFGIVQLREKKPSWFNNAVKKVKKNPLIARAIHTFRRK